MHRLFGMANVHQQEPIQMIHIWIIHGLVDMVLYYRYFEMVIIFIPRMKC